MISIPSYSNDKLIQEAYGTGDSVCTANTFELFTHELTHQNAYIQMHTSQISAGEIRGNIGPNGDMWFANINATQQVPTDQNPIQTWENVTARLLQEYDEKQWNSPAGSASESFKGGQALPWTHLDLGQRACGEAPAQAAQGHSPHEPGAA